MVCPGSRNRSGVLCLWPTLLSRYLPVFAELLLCLVFVLTLPLLNPWVCGDGVGYYAFVRAQLIEHNLDFTEDYRHANQSFREPRIDENACQLLAAVRSCVSKRLRHLQVPPQALSRCIKSLKINERNERCQLDKLRAGGHNSGRPRRRRNSLGKPRASQKTDRRDGVPSSRGPR